MNADINGAHGRLRLQPRVYDADLQSVMSADDLILMVDLGVEDLYKRVRVRLAGVDAPNALHESDQSEAGRARQRVRQMIGRCRLRVSVESVRSSSWICTVEIVSATGQFINLNRLLIDEGYVFKKTGVRE